MFLEFSVIEVPAMASEMKVSRNLSKNDFGPQGFRWLTLKRIKVRFTCSQCSLSVCSFWLELVIFDRTKVVVCTLSYSKADFFLANAVRRSTWKVNHYVKS